LFGKGKRMDNEYSSGAGLFLKKAASIIEESMSRETIIEGTLFFALGTERILKSILFDLNPIYVFKNQDFKTTISILYGSRLLSSSSHNKEISGSPDADLLTFKLSLLRAQAVSEVTHAHSSLLFSLSNWRDIVAHSGLSALDLEKCRLLLLRDFYPLIAGYSAELSVPIGRFIGSHEIRLASLSAKHQESVEDKVRMKLESHRIIWKQQCANPGYEEKMRAKTQLALKASKERSGSFVELVSRPACGNDALLSAEVDFDYCEDQVHPVGVFVSGLRCLFCKLHIEGYDEIDHMKLNELILPAYSLRSASASGGYRFNGCGDS
jgi:hypothetical protein